MSLRAVMVFCGAVGGLAWAARYVLDLAGTTQGTLVDALYWGGLALLAIALVGFGMGLVSKSAMWLRLIVGVAFPALVWSVLEVLRTGDEALVDGAFGAVVVVIAVIEASRSRAEEPRRHAGAHAR